METESQSETAATSQATETEAETVKREGVLAHINGTVTNPGKPSMRAEADYGVDFGVGIIAPEAYLVAVISNEGYETGDLVTAKFELRDSDDEVLSSGRESKRFWSSDDLVFPMRMKLPEDIEAASATVEIIIEADDFDPPAESAQADLEVSSPVLSTISEKPVLAFNVQNTSELAVTKARLDVVCYDEEGQIVGGGEAIPPIISARASLGMHSVLVTSGNPEDCQVFPTVLQSQEPSETTGTDEEDATTK
ncbi:MAG: hypothetical protein Q4D87_05560 [Actinomycetaceae bacterium]|nr:hypothetical protein [Actinomycetaceae bacterium]